MPPGQEPSVTGPARESVLTQPASSPLLGFRQPRSPDGSRKTFSPAPARREHREHRPGNGVAAQLGFWLNGIIARYKGSGLPIDQNVSVPHLRLSIMDQPPSSAMLAICTKLWCFGSPFHAWSRFLRRRDGLQRTCFSDTSSNDNQRDRRPAGFLAKINDGIRVRAGPHVKSAFFNAVQRRSLRIRHETASCVYPGLESMLPAGSPAAT